MYYKEKYDPTNDVQCIITQSEFISKLLKHHCQQFHDDANNDLFTLF